MKIILKGTITLLLASLPIVSFAFFFHEPPGAKRLAWSNLGKVFNFPETKEGQIGIENLHIVTHVGDSYTCDLKESKEDFLNTFKFEVTSFPFLSGDPYGNPRTDSIRTIELNSTKNRFIKIPAVVGNAFSCLDISRQSTKGKESVICYMDPQFTKQISLSFQNEMILTEDHRDGLAFTYELNEDLSKPKKIVCKITNSAYGAYILDLTNNNKMLSHVYETNTIELTSKPVSEKTYPDTSDHNKDIVHIEPHGYIELTNTDEKGFASCAYEDDI